MEKIKIIILAMVCMSQTICDSNAQKYEWSKMVTADDQFVDPNQKIFKGVNGNFFIGMRFFNQIRLGTPPKKKGPEAPVLNAGNQYALYLAKYNIDGTIVWSKMIKTNGGGTKFSALMTEIKDAVEDQNGNIYLTGNFEKSIDFGNGVNLQSKGLNDMFIAKLDSKGNAIWAKRAGGISTINAEPGGFKVALDQIGNVYALGQISGWHDDSNAEDKNGIASFEDQGLEVTIMPPSILAKIAPDGTTLWVKVSNGMPTLNQLELDGKGNIYLAGHALHTSGWDDVEVKVNGLNDMVMAKLDNDGGLLWYKSFGVGNGPYKPGDPIDQDKVLGMAVSHSGKITIAAQIQSGGNIDGKTITGQGMLNMVTFIAGFSSNGEIGEIGIFDPGKGSLGLPFIYKGDEEGRLSTHMAILKPIAYGKEKIKDPGIYRFTNDTKMERLGKVTGMELKGYIVIAWDFLTQEDYGFMTVGTLSTAAEMASSKAIKKYWEKAYSIPKGNAKTGVVYSRFSK